VNCDNLQRSDKGLDELGELVVLHAARVSLDQQTLHLLQLLRHLNIVHKHQVLKSQLGAFSTARGVYLSADAGDLRCGGGFARVPGVSAVLLELLQRVQNALDADTVLL